MSGLMFTSCEWNHWLGKVKSATTMGWSTQGIFGICKCASI